jgi:internalin A
VLLLNLRSTKVTDAGMKELRDLTNLQELVLGSTKVTDVGLKELKELNSLKKLCFDSCPKVTDAGMKELAGLTSLESLYLVGTGVKGPGLKELKGLKRLRTLEFSQDGVTDESCGVCASSACCTRCSRLPARRERGGRAPPRFRCWASTPPRE